jgi:hypothetical protein
MTPDRAQRLEVFRRLREQLDARAPAPPPESEPDRVWVVAGTRYEFLDWCLRHHISPTDRRAIELHERDKWQRIAGAPRGMPYVRIGTWQQRRDLDELQAILRNREARLLSEVTPWDCRATDVPAPSPIRTATAKPWISSAPA